MQETLSRFVVALLRAFVMRGADFFDAHLASGWADVLLAHMPHIDLKDANTCVAGTLAHAGFLNGITEAVKCGTISGFDAFTDKYKLGDGSAYGLNFTQDCVGEFLRTTEEPVRWEQRGQAWSVLMEQWEVEVLRRVTKESVAAALGRMELELLRATDGNTSLVALKKLEEEAEAAMNEAQEALDDAKSERDDAEQALEAANEAVEEARQAWNAADDAHDTARDNAETAEKQHRRFVDAVETMRRHVATFNAYGRADMPYPEGWTKAETETD
jgi:hypothetical protein